MCPLQTEMSLVTDRDRPSVTKLILNHGVVQWVLTRICHTELSKIKPYLRIQGILWKCLQPPGSTDLEWCRTFGQLRNASLHNVSLLSSKQWEHQKSENPLFMLYFSLLKCAQSEAFLPQSKMMTEHFRAFFHKKTSNRDISQGTIPQAYINFITFSFIYRVSPDD